MKRISIKDVAKAAGVSITTVSHALSGGGNLRQETRDRVNEIAKEMHYMPDWKGRNLKVNGTGVIGLFTASIRGYYGILADSMYETCKKMGYEFEIFLSDNGEAVLQPLLSGRVEGAVILHDGFGDSDVEALLETELPTVFLDREIERKYVSSLLFDSYHIGHQAAEYLYAQGHEKLMFVVGSDTYDGNKRMEGFLDAVKEKGKEIPKDYIIDGNFDQEIAYHSMNAFLEKKKELPDAIFAANDDSAFGCIKALAEHGYKVPGDVSIMGCDDVELSKWYLPALTTIQTHIASQGELAAEEIIALVKEEREGRIRRIEGKLIERNSCATK